MKNIDCFFMIKGSSINDDYSNISTIKTTLIPNEGSWIQLKEGIFKVRKIVYNYMQVENYDELNDPDRGGELIYVFVDETSTELLNKKIETLKSKI